MTDFIAALYLVGAIIAGGIIFILAGIGIWHLDVFQRPKPTRLSRTMPEGD